MIDTAEMYRNEEDVGKALKSSGVKREDIFISTFTIFAIPSTDLSVIPSYEGHSELLRLRERTTSR